MNIPLSKLQEYRIMDQAHEQRVVQLSKQDSTLNALLEWYKDKNLAFIKWQFLSLGGKKFLGP